MKAIIKVDRNSALLAGIDNEGEYTITFSPADLTEPQRAELVKSSMKGNSYQVNIGQIDHQGQSITGSFPPVTSADINTMRDLLDARIALREEIDAENFKKHQDFVFENIHSKQDDQLIQVYDYEVMLSYLADKALDAAKTIDDQMAIDRIEKIKSELIPERQAEVDRQHAEEQAARKAAEAASKQALADADMRREQQLAQWVIDHGTKNQRGRYAEGLLDESEIIDGIRELAFLPLADEPRFKKITASDVREYCNDWPDDFDHEVSFQSTDKSTLSDIEYDRVLYLRKMMPGSTVTVIEHNGWCRQRNCESDIYRTGYKVEITVGELKMAREYADIE